MSDKISKNYRDYLLLLFAGFISMFLYSYNISKITFLPDSILIILRASALFVTMYVILERIFKIKIYSRIFIGLIAGVIAGIVFKTSIAEIKPVGDLFIRLIRMIIIPLVFASLLVGSASMNPKKMGRIGAKLLFII